MIGDDSLTPGDLAAIDRLVDGNLNPDDRRGLILRLEDHPQGWRRCALAFLEDQAWRQALGSPKPMAEPIRTLPARSGKFGRFSIAASILVATFGVGLAVGRSNSAGTTAQVAGPVEGVKPPTVVPEMPGLVREVGSIQLVDRSAGETRPEEVPILSGPGFDEEWLRNQPSSVPEYVRAQWERQGYQVEERRKLVSVDLEDGRRVSIPVDEVGLRFVGQQPF